MSKLAQSDRYPKILNLGHIYKVKEKLFHVLQNTGLSYFLRTLLKSGQGDSKCGL